MVLIRSECQISVSYFYNFFGRLNNAIGVGRRALFLKKYSVNIHFRTVFIHNTITAPSAEPPDSSNSPTSMIV